MYRSGDNHPYPIDHLSSSRRHAKSRTTANAPPQRQPLGDLQVVIPRDLAHPPPGTMAEKPHSEARAPLRAAPNINKTNRTDTGKRFRRFDDRDIPNVIHNKKRGRRYERVEYLGRGGFARCFKVKDEAGHLFAAKVLPKSLLFEESYKKKMLAEINIHRTMKHRSIVSFRSCFEDDKNIYLIVELCENGTLMSILNNRGVITEPELRFYLVQILDACRYMHDNRVVHRDLKPANIFLDKNMDCKIGDFGLAALLISNEDRKNTMCGTPHYIAPEILFNSKKGHNQKADLWSVGVLMYNLLTLKHPHEQFEKGSNKRIPMSALEFPPDNTLSKDAKDIITRLLADNPDDRITIPEVLEHPFFQNGSLPESIPRCALQRRPTFRELGIPDPSRPPMMSPGKAADAMRRAIDPNHNYIDRRPVGMLKLASENIPDLRAQFPLPREKKADLVEPLTPKLTATASARKRRHQVLEEAQKAARPSDESSKILQEETMTPSHGASNSAPTPLPTSVVMERMARVLKDSLESAGRLTKKGQPTKEIRWTHQNVFLDKWVDYTSKFGVGYMLSDGSHGVSFNDATSVTTDNQRTYQIIDHRTYPSKISYQEVDQLDRPLKKKVAVMNHFLDYMKDHLNTAAECLPVKLDQPSHTYLTKYIVDEKAIVFRLSNNVIQFNFFDSRKLVLTEYATKIVHMDANKVLKMYMLADAVTSGDKELLGLLDYAKNLLLRQMTSPKKDVTMATPSTVGSTLQA